VAQAQQVVRVDREIRRPANMDNTNEEFLAVVARELPFLDAILVSDYRKGVVTQALMDGMRGPPRGSRAMTAVYSKGKRCS